MSDQALAFNHLIGAIKHDFGAILPETILSIVICVLLLHDLLTKGVQAKRAGVVALIGVAATGLSLWLQDVPAAGREIFGWFRGAEQIGMLRIDRFGTFFKGLITLGTGISIFMTMSFKPLRQRRMGEFYALLLGAALGMFVQASATNLVMFYFGIEFASLSSYLLTAFVKSDQKGSEAGVKYAIYGSVASGVMIFGMSLLYGMTGSLHINDLARTFTATGLTHGTLLIAGAMVFAGFAYKMAAFPMHFWCPDVYEGAATPFTAFLSVTSKAGGFALFVRFLLAFGEGFKVLSDGGGRSAVDWPQLILVASAASMTVGNLGALWQTNVKRMMAYSSIAHAGYLLMAVAVMTPLGAVAPSPNGQSGPLLFYFIAYLFMNLGAFYVVSLVENDAGGTTLDAFRGLGRRTPLMGACLAIFMLSLLGIPPTAGFTGKFQLFMAVIDRRIYWIAVVAGINTAISAYYYFRILKAMYLDEPNEQGPSRFAPAVQMVVAALVIPVLYLGIDFNRVVHFAERFGL